MDMEWAKDGLDGRLYIVQARPETVASQHSVTALETYVLEGRAEILTEGRSVGERIASGAVKRIENLTQSSLGGQGAEGMPRALDDDVTDR